MCDHDEPLAHWLFLALDHQNDNKPQTSNHNNREPADKDYIADTDHNHHHTLHDILSP